MRAALNESESVSIYLEFVRELGLGYDVKRLDQMTFPAYAGSLSLQHAKVR
jgi:hypothetical protein